MFESYGKELLQSGIIEAKGGNPALARRYLERAVNAAATGEHDLLAEIWFWLSQVTDEPAEKRKALENALSYEVRHTRARRELAILDGKIRTDELIEPDSLPTAPRSVEKAETQRFVCPNCGGRLVYAPDGKDLVCESCSGRQKISDHEVDTGKEFLVAMATARGHSRPLNEQILQCQGCGAQYFLPRKQISFNCPYCNSAQVVNLEKSPDLLSPDGILPHIFNREHATKLLVDWVKVKQIVPERKVDRPHGLYLPLWTFDIGGSIGYTGEVVQIELGVLESGQTGEHRVTDEFPVMLSDVAIPASRKPSTVLLKLIPTFDLGSLHSYDPGFLSDWPAEVYDVSMADASLEARSQAYARLKLELPALLSPVKIINTSSAKLTVESFKLVLLPVWMTAVQYKGGTHLVLINGQNGYVQGEDV